MDADSHTLADDQALVDEVLAGRPGAFERLVTRYQKLCWHVIHRMVRHAEDTRTCARKPSCACTSTCINIAAKAH